MFIIPGLTHLVLAIIVGEHWLQATSLALFEVRCGHSDLEEPMTS
jgi:hypothetical protein